MLGAAYGTPCDICHPEHTGEGLSDMLYRKGSLRERLRDYVYTPLRAFMINVRE